MLNKNDMLHSVRLPDELGWLLRRIRPWLNWHIASFLSITAGSLLALVSPLLLKILIDTVLPQKRLGLLMFVVALVFVAHEGKVVLTSVGGYLMLSASQRMALGLRVTLLAHLNTLSANYYDETPVGKAMYPLKEPIEEIAYFGSDLLPAILRMLLTASFTVTAMAMLNCRLTLTIVPLIPVFLFTRQLYRKRITRDADAAQGDRLAWSVLLEEHLSSLLSIQLLGREKLQERRAFRMLANSLRSQQKLYATATRFTIANSMAIVVAMSIVIGDGGRSVLAGNLSLGGLVAFYGLVAQLFDPLSGASELYARTQKTFASIRQVQAVLALSPSVKNRAGPIILSIQHASDLELSSVEFGYPRNKNLLHIPSLRISAGDHLAIAGENGSGKSTLVKLMVRLYDPLSGVVRLGGEDVRNIQLKSLRQRVSYLPRDPVLFDGSIESNLIFALPGASRRHLEHAIEMAGLSKLISSLPDGLKQRIGPSGCQFSGGERQRLALARALLQEPRVLILDEATSCLDLMAEAAVLENLRYRLSLSTLIVVSHRLSTVSDFRRVLFLSRGRIATDTAVSACMATGSSGSQLPVISID